MNRQLFKRIKAANRAIGTEHFDNALKSLPTQREAAKEHEAYRQWRVRDLSTPDDMLALKEPLSILKDAAERRCFFEAVGWLPEA